MENIGSTSDRRGKKVRSSRYVESSLDDLCKSASWKNLKSIYSGADAVEERMKGVRKWIVHIRNNWTQYDYFMKTLRSVLEEEVRIEDMPAVESLLNSVKQWADLDEKSSNSPKKYNAITLFTSNEGQRLFKPIQDIFREENSVNLQDRITSAVFMVELVNIDLFNMCFHQPDKKNFQGVVYRGVSLPMSDVQLFEELMLAPPEGRSISVPLSLWSSSKSKEIAESFIEENLEHFPNHEPLLMKINVLNVDEEYLQYYEDKYKERSILSTICAVDISDLSEYDEEEVLLRGVFLQAINITDNGTIQGKPCKMLELVTTNCNRDHLSTSTKLGEEDTHARELIRSMRWVTLNRFITRYCNENRLVEDAVLYQARLDQEINNLHRLMASS